MRDPHLPLLAAEQRSLFSGALLSRFIFIIVATILIAILPWPYSVLLKLAAISLWAVAGVLAARALQASSDQTDVRRISRALLAVDTLVTAVVVYLYLPLYHEAWAFLLLPVVFGSTQDRRSAAIVTGCVAALAILAGYFSPATRPLVAPRPVDLIMQLAVVGMMALGVELLYRSITTRHSEPGLHGADVRPAGDLSAPRAASSAEGDRMRRAIDLAITLTRERELGPLLDRILDVTTQTFGFRCGAILTAERERKVFAYRSARGYSPEQTRRLMVREVPFAQADLKMDARFQIRPSVYYAPVERQTWHTDPLNCHRPESALVPRERRGAWHEADTLVFALTSTEGDVVGLLSPDAPVDGKVPSDDQIENIALFARLAAVAIENVYVSSVEPHREAAQRIARTLDLTAAIFTERDLDALLHRILATVTDSFGFNAGTILLRERGRDAYVRRAALGFPREVEGKEVTGSALRQMMNERTRVRDTFYYVPMEMNVEGGVTRDPNRAFLPRVETGQWHENDVLLFPIFDSTGELIGVLTPDDPKDRRVPPYEVIVALEIFARIAGLAIETAMLRGLVADVR